MTDENGRLVYDKDVEESGTPRWFSFVLYGEAIEYEEKGPMLTGGRTAAFDWPIPQSVRLSYYLKRGVREDEGYD